MLKELLQGLDEETAGLSDALYVSMLKASLLSQITMSRGADVGDLVALLNSTEQITSLVRARQNDND